jgi:hypothetical protein
LAPMAALIGWVAPVTRAERLPDLGAVGTEGCIKPRPVRPCHMLSCDGLSPATGRGAG